MTKDYLIKMFTCSYPLPFKNNALIINNDITCPNKTIKSPL